ncbi:MAG TPA: hypothetical protein G4O17_04930 [Dehalococcoidia bacterium]|nr:hypothetical protein [Dehalococcoidia bacterium]
MAQETEPDVVGKEEELDIGHIKRRLDMLDQRIDSIDSMITAVAERVMDQPVTVNITCPHCGKNIEIALIGKGKPTK